MRILLSLFGAAAIAGSTLLPVTARPARADWPAEVLTVLGFMPSWGTADNPERPGGGTTPAPEPPPPEPPRG